MPKLVRMVPIGFTQLTVARTTVGLVSWSKPTNGSRMASRASIAATLIQVLMLKTIPQNLVTRMTDTVSNSNSNTRIRIQIRVILV